MSAGPVATCVSGTDDGDSADGDAPAADEQLSASERVQVTDGDGYAVDPAERAADDEFGWRGYVLLGVLVIAFVVAPIVVFLRPPALPRYVSLILFPLLPAVALGIVAVWSAAQS